MATKETNNQEGWIDVGNEFNNDENNLSELPDLDNLTFINQAALENIMDDILELSTADKSSILNKSGNGRTNEFSLISTPNVKSVSSNSSEKNSTNNKEVNGSEVMWYWNSRPEINNYYNCSKWVVSGGDSSQLNSSHNNNGAMAGSPTYSQTDQAIYSFTYTQPHLMQQQVDFYDWVKTYLPKLFLTHACTFILGAAAMYFVLRRFLQNQASKNKLL